LRRDSDSSSSSDAHWGVVTIGDDRFGFAIFPFLALSRGSLLPWREDDLDGVSDFRDVPLIFGRPFLANLVWLAGFIPDGASGRGVVAGFTRAAFEGIVYICAARLLFLFKRLKGFFGCGADMIAGCCW